MDGNLLKLPTELLQHIANQLAIDEYLRLCQSCQSLHQRLDKQPSLYFGPYQQSIQRILHLFHPDKHSLSCLGRWGKKFHLHPQCCHQEAFVYFTVQQRYFYWHELSFRGHLFLDRLGTRQQPSEWHVMLVNAASWGRADLVARMLAAIPGCNGSTAHATALKMALRYGHDDVARVLCGQPSSEKSGWPWRWRLAGSAGDLVEMV
ncbi:hypothetical protein HDV03_004164 [Kappamyces sp. JEL0829]|nr:hypothetical protein HDV03_004164 [Kappamyces sp. JEL0829]